MLAEEIALQNCGPALVSGSLDSETNDLTYDKIAGSMTVYD
jgi:hypothetical protein